MSESIDDFLRNMSDRSDDKNQAETSKYHLTGKERDYLEKIREALLNIPEENRATQVKYRLFLGHLVSTAYFFMQDNIADAEPVTRDAVVLEAVKGLYAFSNYFINNIDNTDTKPEDFLEALIKVQLGIMENVTYIYHTCEYKRLEKKRSSGGNPDAFA